jgi:hypothetical protein
MPGFNVAVRNPSYERTKAYRANPPIWVSWKYDAAEWAVFDAWEWKRAKREAWRVFWSYGAIALAGLLVSAGLAIYSQDPNWLLIAVPVVWGLGGGGLANAWIRYSPARRLHQACRQGNRTVTITPISISQADISTPLVDQQLVLRRVWVTNQGQPILHFHLTLYRRGSTQYEIRVPIPRGQVEEALHLVDTFQKQVI